MDMKKEVGIGLQSTPKYLPAWYRYDNEGSRLNDMCLEKNENYYFHRCELGILKTHISNMLELDMKNSVLVDMGSGNCQKTRMFIDEILKKKSHLAFYPIDISNEMLLDTCKKLSDEYAEKLDINPIGADYETGISEIKQYTCSKLILWFGSIQCLEPDDQVRKLKLVKSVMTAGCSLIFSVDITQERDDIMKAYNDFHGENYFLYI
ncbi:histidine N-alpha-methyltransferase-like [Ylistrum balloti]|uniref:histidine N-alpha-methyltransferase-like n=1 Tax=Ylistrum balloti TaxID=509963 RepID=UPI002905D464|nr:histidine N-alpha-methyltransferase-like [Ylistrum balloti]